MKATEEYTTVIPKSKRLTRTLLLVAAVSLVFSIVCFTVPMVSKNLDLNARGAQVERELLAASVVLTQLSGDSLSDLTASPTAHTFTPALSHALTQICVKNSYEGITLITKSGAKQYTVLADSAIRYDAPNGGEKSLSGGSEYPLTVYRHSQKLLADIFSGKKTFACTTDLVTARNGVLVSTAFIPVYAARSSLVESVLAVDISPSNPSYHIVGPLNLTYAAWFFLLLFAVSIAVIVLMKKFAETRDVKNTDLATPEPLPPISKEPLPTADPSSAASDDRETGSDEPLQ